MKCTCAVADSFNVRVADLINPSCPIHGCKLSRCPAREIALGADRATVEELELLVKESLQIIRLSESRPVSVLRHPLAVSDIARNLLARYEIRRKR